MKDLVLIQELVITSTDGIVNYVNSGVQIDNHSIYNSWLQKLMQLQTLKVFLIGIWVPCVSVAALVLLILPGFLL